jgi:hypothetical protein
MDILSKANDHMAECEHGLTISQVADLIRYVDSLGIEGTLLDCSVSFVLLVCEQARAKRRARLHLVTPGVPTRQGRYRGQADGRQADC